MINENKIAQIEMYFKYRLEDQNLLVDYHSLAAAAAALLLL